MSILILMLIFGTTPRWMDMLALDDTLFITMVESYQVTLYRYESTTLIAETYLGNHSNVSIGYTGDGDDQSILVMCSSASMKGYLDSLYAIDPDDLSLIWKTGDLPWIDDPYLFNHFIERWHPETRFPRLISYYCSHVTDASDHQWILSNVFNPDTYPVIWEEPLYYHNYGGYIGDCFMGPVTVADKPVITGLVNNHGSPVPYYPNWWSAQIQVHEAETDSIMRVLPITGGQYEQPPFYPNGYCIGSCSTHAVMLWSDTTGTIYSTEVAGSPLEIVSTEPFEFSLPTDSSVIAASRNPNDSGILICYYNNGYIWARYMEEFWFAYEHQVAPATSVYCGKLTLSGTPDGYWISWSDGSSYPNIAWIARETLTGISESQSAAISDLWLSAAPNPFRGIVEVTVNSDEIPVQINIYDTSGHQVHSGRTDASGHYSWDAQSMPAGVYLIRAIQDIEFVDSKILLIR